MRRPETVLTEKDILALQLESPIIALQMEMVVVQGTFGQEVCHGAVAMGEQGELAGAMEQMAKMEVTFRDMVEEVMVEQSAGIPN